MNEVNLARIETLREKARGLTKDPGVYLMKSGGGEVIYVGKAKNLKNRVSTYFLNLETADPKTRKLVSEIVDFDSIAYNSELEAYLAERTLIKHHKPKYNILLRDDKEYPFVRVSLNEEWPRFKKVRRMKDDGAKYIGPFASGHSLNIAMQLMYKIFPLIRCSPHEFKTAKRPCNYYHMKRCLGPCTLPVPREDYLTLVKHALDFLSGDNKKIIQELRQAMKLASQNEEYEKAALFRDQIEAMIRLVEPQALVSSDLPEADVLGLVKWGDEVCVHVTTIRDAHVVGGDNFYLLTPLEGDDALANFLAQYYDQRFVPEKILLPHEPADAETVREFLQKDGKVEFVYENAKSSQVKELLGIAQKNAAYALEGRNADKSSVKVELEVLREFLGITTFPRLIECFDISNFQGGSIVAAKVSFLNGQPNKDQYRRYEIESVEANKPDDFQSMREVVGRRLRQGIKDGDLPDLIVIDGGRGQLSAALEAAKEFEGLNIEIVSLAKKKLQRQALRFRDHSLNYNEERVFRAGDDRPLILVPGSVPYRILTRIRDETHRFAITYHRKKRDKKTMGSVLDQIPGLGTVLKKRLLQQFGSVVGIQNSTVEELRMVKGVSEKIALEIRAFFANSP